jgi:hypothetical protein
VLTKEQRDFFEENGFLVIPNLVSPDLLENYRARFVDIAEGSQPVRKYCVRLLSLTPSSIHDCHAGCQRCLTEAQGRKVCQQSSCCFNHSPAHP